MAKVDLKKELGHLYKPSAKEVSMVDVPAMQFLMVDGEGDPSISQAFQEAIEALYGLSYTLKFMAKKREGGQDYVVMPLEGLFWVAEGLPGLSQEEAKGDWKWTIMIMQPEWITEEMFGQAREELAYKKDPPALPRVRFEWLHEGLSAQIMHIGPYSAEWPTIEKLHRFIEESGYRLRGKHHEVYLSDPNRTAPERLKTVIRQPMEKQGA